MPALKPPRLLNQKAQNEWPSEILSGEREAEKPLKTPENVDQLTGWVFARSLKRAAKKRGRSWRRAGWESESEAEKR